MLESSLSNEQQIIGNHSKWSNKWTDNVHDSKCGLPGHGHRLVILCAYSALSVLCDLLNHALLVLQALYQHHSFFWLPHLRGNLLTKFVPKTFNGIEVRWAWYTLHDPNPLVPPEACYHTGHMHGHAMGSCIVLLEQSDLTVCFHRSLQTVDLLIHWWWCPIETAAVCAAGVATQWYKFD